MPVVGCADLDRVDIIPAQDFPVIHVSLAAPVGAGALLLGVELLDHPPGGLPAADLSVPVPRTLPVDVADRDDSDTFVPHERVDVVEPLISRPDDTQRDLIAGRDRTG